MWYEVAGHLPTLRSFLPLRLQKIGTERSNGNAGRDGGTHRDGQRRTNGLAEPQHRTELGTTAKLGKWESGHSTDRYRTGNSGQRTGLVTSANPASNHTRHTLFTVLATLDQREDHLGTNPDRLRHNLTTQPDNRSLYYWSKRNRGKNRTGPTEQETRYETRRDQRARRYGTRPASEWTVRQRQTGTRRADGQRQCKERDGTAARERAFSGEQRGGSVSTGWDASLCMKKTWDQPRSRNESGV